MSSWVRTEGAVIWSRTVLIRRNQIQLFWLNAALSGADRVGSGVVDLRDDDSAPTVSGDVVDVASFMLAGQQPIICEPPAPISSSSSSVGGDPLLDGFFLTWSVLAVGSFIYALPGKKSRA